jgi:sterol desaturase/sphingolipid hydroxylase (fatty acid hydroxylase superfamily)
MDIHAFEAFLRDMFEPLQYMAFFGALLVFGLIEALIPAGAGEPQRSGRWPSNFLLTLLNVLVLSLMPVSGLFAADYGAAQNWGLLNWIGLAGVAAVVAGLLARSLLSYGIHVAMHKLPLLWRVHRVHHSDAFLDVSTAVRLHPIEFLISVPILVAAILVLGIPPLAIIIYELFDAAMAVWTHSNSKLPRWLERIMAVFLVTPSMHRIHHSQFQPETDSNYGTILPIWDKLFGTYRAKDEASLAAMQLGLRSIDDRQGRSFFWLIRLPFIGRLAPSRRPAQSSGPMSNPTSAHGPGTG